MTAAARRAFPPSPLQRRPLRHVTVEHAQNVRWEGVTFSEDEAMGALMEKSE